MRCFTSSRICSLLSSREETAILAPALDYRKVWSVQKVDYLSSFKQDDVEKIIGRSTRIADFPRVGILQPDIHSVGKNAGF